MSWFKRKPKDVIPNPRERRNKHLDRMDSIQRDILYAVQFFVFGVALMILLAVS